jgi:hypothetical protein
MKRKLALLPEAAEGIDITLNQTILEPRALQAAQSKQRERAATLRVPRLGRGGHDKRVLAALHRDPAWRDAPRSVPSGSLVDRARNWGNTENILSLIAQAAAAGQRKQ